MDRVNLVFVEDSWILAYMARQLHKHLPALTATNAEAGEVHYFINYAQYREMPGISMALFTHLEERGRTRDLFINVAKKVDYPVAMCENTADVLSTYTNTEPTVIHFGVDALKPLKFGVAGRTYATGRKGESLVHLMMQNGYDVTALGRGWPCPEAESREDFFNSIDYFVVTALNEGGPYDVLEALARGIPVIAPDVGWCWEYSTIPYQRGNWNSLLKTLKGLQPPTWEDCANSHARLFSGIL